MNNSTEGIQPPELDYFEQLFRACEACAIYDIAWGVMIKTTVLIVNGWHLLNPRDVPGTVLRALHGLSH